MQAGWAQSRGGWGVWGWVPVMNLHGHEPSCIRSGCNRLDWIRLGGRDGCIRLG